MLLKKRGYRNLKIKKKLYSKIHSKNKKVKTFVIFKKFGLLKQCRTSVLSKNILKNWEFLNFFQQEGRVLSNTNEVVIYSNYYNNQVFSKNLPLYFLIVKEKLLYKWNKSRWLHFVIKEFIRSLDKTSLYIFKEASFSILKTNYFLEQNNLKLFSNYIYSRYFYSKYNVTQFNSKKYSYRNVSSSLIYILISLSFFTIIQNLSSSSISKLKLRKNILELFSYFISEFDMHWEIKENLLFQNNYSFGNLEIKKKKVLSYFSRRTFLKLFNKYNVSRVLLSRNKFFLLKNYLWKGKNKFREKNIQSTLLRFARFFNKKNDLKKREISYQMLYLLSRIDEKLEKDKNNEENVNLLNFRTLFLNFLKNKITRIKERNNLLGNRVSLIKYSRRKNVVNFLKNLNVFLKNKKMNEKEKLFVKKVCLYLFKSKKKKKIIKYRKQKKLKSRIRKNINYTEKDSKKKINKKVIKYFLKNIKKKIFCKFRFLILKKKRVKRMFRFFTRKRRIRKRWEKKKVEKKLRKKNNKISYFLKELPLSKKKHKLKFKKTKRNKVSKIKMFLKIKLQNIWKRKKNIKLKKKRVKLKIKRNWTGKKLIVAEKYMTLQQKKQLLSSWINRPLDIIFINSLALSKMAFKKERLEGPLLIKNKKQLNPNFFLSLFDRDLINRYKYIGIYIKDLVRVAFLSVFFKKPSFLAKFVAFQLVKLPKNRKETAFIRFLIKTIRTFGAGRKEILGVRVKFKGRVNRWRRTKFILGNRGTFPLHKISERIEQGTAQAINRKGAIGIRIWFRYKQAGAFVLRTHFLNYIKYSQKIKRNRIIRNILIK